MSKSAKNDNHKTRTRGTNPSAQNDNRATALGKRGLHPWAEAVDSIDFGPAVAAVADLAGWALDLAAADIAEWPEGARRVRICRRYVLRQLRGRHTRGVPYEDILFTAGLLARIFEAEIGLGMSEVVAVLDKIGLPTEVVPMMPRAQPHVQVPVSRTPAPRDEIVELFRVAIQEMDEDDLDKAPCGECGHCPGHRNAA